MNKKILIILFIVLALAVAVLLYFQAKKKKGDDAPQMTIIPGGATGTGAQATSNPLTVAGSTQPTGADSNKTSFPLQAGSRGKAVKLIQAALGVPITGIWDNATDIAIQPYNGSRIVEKDDFVSAITVTGDMFPIGRGDTGEVVKDIQILVGTTPDGKFGPKTEAALQAVTGKATIDSAYDFVSIVNTVLGMNIYFGGNNQQPPLAARTSTPNYFY